MDLGSKLCILNRVKKNKKGERENMNTKYKTTMNNAIMNNYSCRCTCTCMHEQKRSTYVCGCLGGIGGRGTERVFKQQE
jgi:hypothetical protein